MIWDTLLFLILGRRVVTLLETAQLLGNFGEFFGAIAVVVTLVYLSIQVRHNTLSNRLNAQARVLEMANTALSLRTNPTGSHIWLTGLTKPDQLTPEETHSFYNMMLIQVNAVQITQLNRQWSTHLQEIDINPFGEFSKYPGFRKWFESNKLLLGTFAREEIENAMRGVTSD